MTQSWTKRTSVQDSAIKIVAQKHSSNDVNIILFTDKMLLKLRLHDTTGCQTGCHTDCHTGVKTGCIVYNRFDNPLYRVYSRLLNRLYNRFKGTVAVHSTRLWNRLSCQTRLTTGWTTGWMFVYTIQPVVKRVVKPVWQPAVSCKRGFTVVTPMKPQNDRLYAHPSTKQKDVATKRLRTQLAFGHWWHQSVSHKRLTLHQIYTTVDHKAKASEQY